MPSSAQVAISAHSNTDRVTSSAPVDSSDKVSSSAQVYSFTRGTSSSPIASSAHISNSSPATSSTPVTTTSTVARNSWRGPCGSLMEVAGLEGPVTSTSLLDTARDLMIRTGTITNLIEDSLIYLRGEIIKIPLLVDWLDTLVFIPTDRTTVTAENIADAINDPTSALLHHYSLLYEVAMYIDHVMGDQAGTLHGLTGDGNIRERLRAIVEQVYNSVCSVTIGLINQGASTDVAVGTETVLSGEFTDIDVSNLRNEMSRVYVVLRDGQRVMHLLFEVYDSMAQSLIT